MLDKKYDFKEKEPKWQNIWEEKDVYKFNLNSEKPSYKIDTPPPTISGKLHTGHMFSYVHIDAIARYKRMSGYNVFFPLGFDDNGLPTARYVEKKYKIKADRMDRNEFIEQCLKETAIMEPEFHSFFKSLGFSCGFKKTYSSIENETQKISQLSFLDLYKKGEIYRKKSATLWCPECKTAIALSELESEEIPSKMNYIYFKVKETGENLEVMTTRPELLSACVCVFVHPEDKKRANLVGKTAISPYYNKEVPIIANPDVLIDKGTGVVMCCTFGDEADMQWQKTYNLPILEAILPNGTMSELALEFAGLKVKEAREQIIEKLKELKLCYKQEDTVHIVSTHERCHHEVEILTKPQWFIKLLDHQKEIYEMGDKVEWRPETMKKRFLNWVDGLKWDWCISRQNPFGVSFPVWYCKKCGKIHLADESELPVNPLKTQPNVTCECGCGEWLPEVDVMDTWATSSLTPQICMNMETGFGLDGSHLPMDLRPNAHDNIRVWDFYTIAKSLLHFGKLPWTNVMISGFVVDEKGDKISKSKGNEKETPVQIVANRSADVTRYWACNMSLGKDGVFSLDEFTSGAKLVQKIWNASKFVLMFKEGAPKTQPKLLPMDKWILECLKETQHNFENQMAKYEMGLALKEVEKLFWNFCDNYIEIAKNRLYKPEIYGEEAKQSAQYASLFVLKELLKMFACYMPHITEEIYMDSFAKEDGNTSIHTSTYNKLEGDVDKQLLESGFDVVEIVSAIRGEKSKNNVSLKNAVEKLVVKGYSDFVKENEQDIIAVGNVLNIEYQDGEKEVNVTLAPAEEK